MGVLTEGSVVLESGDRLTRDEFHRRYCARPDIRKAELVQGVVYVASPLNAVRHGEPHGLANLWIGAFCAMSPGHRFADNATVYLGPDSEVQPDVCIFWDPPQGGLGRLRDDGYLEGPPVLVMEIAASSASYDLHDKKEAYRRAGVPEYIVWRVLDERIDWFRLIDGEYIRIEPDERGVIESATLSGLRLPVVAMLAGNTAAVLAVLGFSR